MRQIATLNQLQDLQNSTWIYAIAVCVIAIVIAYLVSNMIAWRVCAMVGVLIVVGFIGITFIPRLFRKGVEET